MYYVNTYLYVSSFMAYICNFPDIMRIRWSGLCKTDVSGTWRLDSTERRLHNFDKERRKNDMAFL